MTVFFLNFRYKLYRIFISFLVCMVIVGCSDNQSSVSEQNPFPEEPELSFSRLLTNQKFYSAILGADVTYAVLLPEGYDTSKDDYPVVYLFHGFGDKENAWYASGSIQYYSDQYQGEIVPMIFVMPSAYNSYYANRFNGKYPYMDMLTKDMVPVIDNLFRTKRNKKYRAAMGYSMGGYGALILPALNPNIFSIGVPLSMSFRTDEQYILEPQSVFDYQWSPIFGGVGASGQNRITDYFKQYSPFHFFKNQDASNFLNLKLFIDCGDDEESLSITNNNLHTLLRDLNISHQYRVRSGGHSFDYWKKSYPEALKFISDAFQDIEFQVEPIPAVVGDYLKDTDYETITISDIVIKVMKNKNYSTSEASKFPVLYMIHDYNTQSSTNRLSALSLINNTMNKEVIPQAIIVEVPSSDALNSLKIKEIIAFIDSNYRTLAQKENRIILGNSKGGLKAAQFVNNESSFFSSCFLFDANLADVDVAPDLSTFYYLDIVDDSQQYKGYHQFYTSIKTLNIDYEYRVRQGRDVYQSFLNGLENSFSILKNKI